MNSRAHVLEAQLGARLRGAAPWRVVSLCERPVAALVRALAERLRDGPRAPA